jgi:hypothetical protein
VHDGGEIYADGAEFTNGRVQPLSRCGSARGPDTSMPTIKGIPATIVADHAHFDRAAFIDGCEQ